MTEVVWLVSLKLIYLIHLVSSNDVRHCLDLALTCAATEGSSVILTLFEYVVNEAICLVSTLLSLHQATDSHVLDAELIRI